MTLKTAALVDPLVNARITRALTYPPVLAAVVLWVGDLPHTPAGPEICDGLWTALPAVRADRTDGGRR